MSKKITFNCIWFQQFKQIPHYKKKCCYLIIYFMNLQRSHNANVKDCSPTVKTNMQVNLLDVIPAGRQNRKQMSERDGITCTGRGNEWTRVEECDRGRQFLLAGSGLSVPASLRRSDIHQVCLSVLDSGSTEGPFKIRPLLPLAQLQIKAHSEGDSYAHRPPLGNGWDGPMSAFVEGESRAERSRRQTERNWTQNEGGKRGERCKHKTQNTFRQQDTSSIGGPVGTYWTFVQWVLYTFVSPFLQGLSLGLGMWLRAAAMHLVCCENTSEHVTRFLITLITFSWS